MLRRYPALLQFSRSEAHHNLGTTDQRYSVFWIKWCSGDKLRDDTDAAVPGTCSAIHRDVHLQAEVRSPAFQFAAVENVLWRAGAIEEHDFVVFFTLCYDLV